MTLTQEVPERRARALGTAVVAISGDDVYEDLFGVGTELQRQLVGLGLAASQRMGMAWIDEPAPDLAVLYTAMGALSDERMTRLADCVEHGMGLLVVHTTTVFPTEDSRPLPPFDRAFALYGSRYVSHGPVPHSSRFEVHLNPGHPVTAGLAEFALEHEHYAIETTDDVEVLAWRDAEHGREPLLHAREQGAGRVLYLQLGHDTRALGEPGVRELLSRAVHWLVPAGLDESKGSH